MNSVLSLKNVLIYEFVTIFIAVYLDYYEVQIDKKQVKSFKNVEFDTNERTFYIQTDVGGLRADLGLHLNDLNSEIIRNEDFESHYCISWDVGSTLCINQSTWTDKETNCYEMTWTSNYNDKQSGSPKDCFPMTTGQWFGGPEVFRPHWPFSNNLSIPMQMYTSKDVIAHKEEDVYGSFVERYFLNSLGIAIIVDDLTPLWIGINDNFDDRLCLMAKYFDPEYPRNDNKKTILKYNICTASNLKAGWICQTTRNGFRDPVWSTWAKYKQNINQSATLQFADEILKNGFSNSQLEIDDKWSTAYGDLTFDPVKFSDPKGMIQSLHNKGFRVTLWTTPFVNVNSKLFQSSMNFCWLESDEEILKASTLRSMFVQTQYADTPALIKWWDGYGALVDFTSSIASEWYLDLHRKMQDCYLVDSFKFDAGEVEYFPMPSKTKIDMDSPVFYSTHYVQTISQLGGMVEVRSGYKTQHLPIFVRMMDKDSEWGYENGLKTLIPTCLTLGINGYPFILPDMIGGNVYYGHPIPDRQLYIRWLEITAFMPAMQFSVVPWQYDEEVTRIAKKFVDLHREYVTPIVLKYADVSTKEDGMPIIRPLWWIDPLDGTALSIDDEFLIGEEVLVAPILEYNARQRDIYLPGGPNIRWIDQKTNKVYESEIWLLDFVIDLDEVAYFRIDRHQET
uniref:myogenesis-regulating glycosidase-like n=1 Tax=Styela clava TaxID=7725 RepID=UPI00193A24A4|nr:myogenesis-regulating glycosidase-like [Styela clava]